MEATPAIPRSMRQTAMDPYLVHQSIEMRKKSLQAGAESQYTDMSASPSLKKRKPTKKRMLGVRKTSTKVMGFVGVLAKTIEERQIATNYLAVTAPKTELNNCSSVQCLTEGGNALSTAQLNPEMALHADYGNRPIAPIQESHVTGHIGAEPTTAKIKLCEEIGKMSGHFDAATLARNNLGSRE